MNALVLALGLALGPEGFEEDRLPRSLADSFDAPAADSAQGDHGVYVGIHLGAADAIDGATASLVAGFEWRIHMLPWLGAAGSVDYQTKEQVDNIVGASFMQIPLMLSLLLYPPLELAGFKPFAQGGIGVTVTDLSGTFNHDTTDFNLLYFAGFGLEYELGSSILLSVDLRYIWAKDPPGAIGFSGNWKQMTVGFLVKLPN